MNMKFEFEYKKQKYLVRINPDIACRGGARGKGTITNVWRISNNPLENNENGVIPGVKGWQGPYSETALKKFLKGLVWD